MPKIRKACVIIFVSLLFLCFQQIVSAKRAAPVEVEPVQDGRVRYSAPVSRMGFVEAHDISTGEKIWEKKVYQIFYNPFLEKDTQDIYIVSLRMNEGGLVVKDERGRYHRVKIPEQIFKKTECGPCSARPFDYKKDLFDPLETLLINVKSVDSKTGQVLVTAMDTRAPKGGLVYDWGDGRVERGYYRQTHQYKDKARNYCLTVTARYPGHEGRTQALIRFVPTVMEPITLSEAAAVVIPDHVVPLMDRANTQERPDPVYTHLTYFDDTFFNLISRRDVEHILSAASALLYDLFDGDIIKAEDGFKQVLLRDPKLKLMYALWYTRPVAIACGNYGFSGVIQYSSFFHEIAHNYVLNFPSRYCYGKEMVGPGSGFFSESMSQIIQHVIAYEVVNHYDTYGLSEDVAFDLKRRAINTAKIVRQGYESYKAAGMPFCSWGDTADGSGHAASDTYMTVAYMFFVHAENAGQGYLAPLKRMIDFLRIFDQDIKYSYDAGHDTPEASIFRATFMTAALSYAFGDDLRQEFKGLNFPVQDEGYVGLLNRFKRQKGES